MQSGTGRLSCSRTALKRCPSTETRWYKWLVSLVSPEIEEILLSRSFRSRMADALKTPRVSTANWFKHVTSNNARVLYLLASGRHFCCRPCLTGGVSDIWLSQRAGYCDVPAQRLAALPRNECETIWSLPVRPEQPDGLFGEGTPAEAKLQAIKSLWAWCLADLPGALLHTKLWSQRASTNEPQWLRPWYAKNEWTVILH